VTPEPLTPAALAAIDDAVQADRVLLPGGVTLIAIGWSTVDHDRAAASLGLDTTEAPDDEALGARCRLAALPDGRPLVLLEPSTEGRLAGSLARLGEGPVATWWEVHRIGDLDAGPPTAGPFGHVRLLRAPRDGRFRFLRERLAATIPA
jgi:hypothetical protein